MVCLINTGLDKCIPSRYHFVLYELTGVQMYIGLGSKDLTVK
jgi:hypothetical protein